MTIQKKLADFYQQCQFLGYIPSEVEVSQEELKEYLKSLRDMTEALGLVWSQKIDTPTYKGIELKVYGKKHTDEKLKKSKQSK